MKWLNEPVTPEPRLCIDLGCCGLYLFCTGSHECCDGFNCFVNMVN